MGRHSDHHRQTVAASQRPLTSRRAAAAALSYHWRTQPPYVQPRHQRRFIATTAEAQARSASSARARTSRPGEAPAQALRDRSWSPLGHPLGEQRKRDRLEAALLPVADARRFIHSIGLHREHAHVREPSGHETPAPLAARTPRTRHENPRRSSRNQASRPGPERRWEIMHPSGIRYQFA